MKKNYEQPRLEKDLFQNEELLAVSGGVDGDVELGDNNDGTLNDVYDLLK